MPEYAVLDKDTIKTEIMPYLSIAKRGYNSKFDLIEVVNAILYKLKSGCQWRLLPDRASFSAERDQAGTQSSIITVNGVKKRNGRRSIPEYLAGIKVTPICPSPISTVPIRQYIEAEKRLNIKVERNDVRPTRSFSWTIKAFHSPCPSLRPGITPTSMR